jgi:hypothetical protein
MASVLILDLMQFFAKVSLRRDSITSMILIKQAPVMQ